MLRLRKGLFGGAVRIGRRRAISVRLTITATPNALLHRPTNYALSASVGISRSVTNPYIRINFMTPTPKFKSFFMAGFECTYALTEIRKRLDMLKATMHDVYCRDDYRMLKEVGIKTVREGLSWHQIDSGGRYDFSRFEQMMQIGQEEGMQQIWDLNHFDYPHPIKYFSDDFVKRFAEYSKRAIDIIRKYQSGTLYIAPINEISFSAWIGADRGVWAPYTKGRDNGFKFKVQLVKAAIAAIKAISALDKNIRFIHIDPFMRRKAKPPASKAAINHVNDFNNIVRFEAWDMIAGKTFPEFGGEPKFLDIVGLNYYFHNQEWVLSKKNGSLGFSAMDWGSKARISFAAMIKEVYERYQRPILISETGSYGKLRSRWWGRTLRELVEGKNLGLPICGVCAYPALDRPAHINYLIPESGLWDFHVSDKSCRRVPHAKSLSLIKKFINNVKG